VTHEKDEVLECPVSGSDAEYPCTRTSKEILEVLRRQQKQLEEHSKTLEEMSRVVSETNANMAAVVDQQRVIGQHLFNLEKRYAQLDCLKPRSKTPSRDLPHVGHLRAVDQNGAEEE